MCNSKIKPAVAEIAGRPVLQPSPNASNRIAPADPPRPLKQKTFHKCLSLPASFSRNTATDVDPKSPPSKPSAPASPTPKATHDLNGLATSNDKLALPKPSAKSARLKRSKSVLESPLIPSDRAPGIIAAAERELAVLVLAQRKMRIAHYGRTPAKLEAMVLPADPPLRAGGGQEEKRCSSFVGPNADPVCVAYHDEEWGVPVRDDKMLFELLFMAGAQVDLDWTTILKKRQEFREAFAEFDADLLSKFTDRQILSTSAACELELGRVRGFVDNAKRILEVRREFGSLDKYLWGFVNHKPLTTSYKSCRKIPVKTSKSEFISKDMVRRGFRFVGPTVIHSFMQAAGLTNDHLVSCPRQPHCSSLCNNRAPSMNYLLVSAEINQ